MPSIVNQFSTVSGILAANVANNGTVVVPYPSGKNQRSFNAGLAAPAEHYIILGGSSRFNVPSLSLAFNAGDITVTNLSGQTWPAGSEYLLNIGERNGNTVVEVLPFTVPLAAIVGAGNIVTDYRPAVAGTIEQIDAVVTQPGTGAGATVTLNWQIDTVPIAGSTITPTLANTATLGAILSTTPTAANRITRESQLRLVASGVAAFTGGFVNIMLRVRKDQDNVL